MSSSLTASAAHPLGGRRIWPQLPPDLTHRIVSFLPPNEVACTVRLLNRVAAAQFSGPAHTLVRLSQTVPHHAFAWRWGPPDAATRSLNRTQRAQLVALTAGTGVIANLEVAVAAAGLARSDEPVAAAAAAGKREACEWLAARGYPLGLSLPSAARGGHVSLCQWALARGCPWSEDALAGAAEGGHSEIVLWLLSYRPTGHHRGLNYEAFLPVMARFADLGALQRVCDLLEEDRRGELAGGAGAGLAAAAAAPLVVRAGMTAAAAGSLTRDWRAKLLWLESQGCPREEEALVAAAGAGGPDARERLVWLRDRGYPLHSAAAAATAAARLGDLAALSYLLSPSFSSAAASGAAADITAASAAGDHDDDDDDGSNGGGGSGLVLDDDDATTAAAGSGQLEALKLLLSRGAPASERSVRAAAWGGFLNVVQWLLDVGGAAVYAPLDAALMERAVHSGDLGLLAWLRDRGCPWDEQVLGAAAATGRMEVVAWLVARGCPRDEHLAASAAAGGCVEMLERLVGEQGCPLRDGWPYLAAARGGDIAMLECLGRLGCPWGAAGDVFTRAVCRGGSGAPLDALQWLMRAGCPVDWGAALAAADELQMGRQEVMAWLAQEQRLLQQRQEVEGEEEQAE